MRTLLRTRFRPMSLDDVPQVADIERESFPTMWPQTAYRRELQNQAARYIVLTELRDQQSMETPPPEERAGLIGAIKRRIGGGEPASVAPAEYLLGFAGIWLMVGEAHIVTIAVRHDYRRMGIGERMVIACIEMATEFDQEVVTLEVRKSNEAAQALYAKYGFDRVGLRVRYYTDNHEDAVIMTTPELTDAAFRSLFGELRERHRVEHPDLWP